MLTLYEIKPANLGPVAATSGPFSMEYSGGVCPDAACVAASSYHHVLKRLKTSLSWKNGRASA
jgi:hypothetical protein